jgi:hypothetical protein
MSDLVSSIDVERRQGNLSSCLRLFVLDFYRFRLTELTDARAASPGDDVAVREAKSA